jgi:hypothetical protein
VLLQLMLVLLRAEAMVLLVVWLVPLVHQQAPTAQQGRQWGRWAHP